MSSSPIKSSSPSLSIQTRSTAKKQKDAQICFDEITEQNSQEPSSAIITQGFLYEQIASLKTHFDQKLLSQKEDIINQLQNENIILKADILELKDKVKEKSDLIIAMEKDIIDVQQYIRRNNLEICGIPDSVANKDLEKKVIDLAAAIDVKIQILKPVTDFTKRTTIMGREEQSFVLQIANTVRCCT